MCPRAALLSTVLTQTRALYDRLRSQRHFRTIAFQIPLCPKRRRRERRGVAQERIGRRQKGREREREKGATRKKDPLPNSDLIASDIDPAWLYCIQPTKGLRGGIFYYCRIILSGKETMKLNIEIAFLHREGFVSFVVINLSFASCMHTSMDHLRMISSMVNP